MRSGIKPGSAASARRADISRRAADRHMLERRRAELAAVEKALTMGRKGRRKHGIKATQKALVEAAAHDREIVATIEARMQAA